VLAAPVAPVGPVGPVAPVVPVAPVAPVGPKAPTDPQIWPFHCQVREPTLNTSLSDGESGKLIAAIIIFYHSMVPASTLPITNRALSLSKLCFEVH